MRVLLTVASPLHYLGSFRLLQIFCLYFLRTFQKPNLQKCFQVVSLFCATIRPSTFEPDKNMGMIMKDCYCTK